MKTNKELAQNIIEYMAAHSPIEQQIIMIEGILNACDERDYHKTKIKEMREREL